MNNNYTGNKTMVKNRKKEQTVYVNFRVTKELRDEMQRVANESDRTLVAIFRRAVKAEIAKHDAVNG